MPRLFPCPFVCHPDAAISEPLWWNHISHSTLGVPGRDHEAVECVWPTLELEREPRINSGEKLSPLGFGAFSGIVGSQHSEIHSSAKRERERKKKPVSDD